jgi:hypothetical protein
MAWDVKTWNGSTFVDGTDFVNPWDVQSKYVSTEQTEQLADGSEGTVLPTVKAWRSLSLYWGSAATALKSQIEGYIAAGTIIKLTDLLSNAYIGRFRNCDTKETNGVIVYDISCEFRQVNDPSA